MPKAISLPPSPDVSTGELILQAASAIFARKGYYGASIRDIASAVGISVATLYYYVENKEDLYRQVFRRQYEEEQALISGILEAVDDALIRDPQALRALVFRVMDALIERSAANPDIVSLWTRRWLEKPESTEDIEKQYSLPLYQMVENLLVRAREAGTIHPQVESFDLLVHSFTWLNYGYFGFGQLTFGHRVDDPYDPRQVESFRQYIHQFFDLVLHFSSST